MNPDFAASLVHFLGMMLLIASFWILASPQIGTCIRAYATHSFLLALITAVIAVTNHIEHLLIPALLTLVLKTIVIPHVFFRIIRRLGIRKEVESYINIPFSLLLAATIRLRFMVPVLWFPETSWPAAFQHWKARNHGRFVNKRKRYAQRER